MEVFTPLNHGRTKRLCFDAKDVKLIAGNLNQRKRGYQATVEINGCRFKVIGRACSIPNCMCDAELIPITR